MRKLTEEALRTISRGKDPEALSAALGVLPRGDPGVRDAILARYRRLALEGPRRDSGCFLRTALLRGLSGWALPADVQVLEEALETYEFLPAHPEFREIAANLRAAALVALAQLDDELASFHAVRLLGDRYTSPMSGEPAATAARLLAAQERALPLYQHLLGRPAQAEVAAECVRGLAAAPVSVLARLAEDQGLGAGPTVLLALVDLLLGHPQSASFAALLMRLVEESEELDVVRYLAAAIVAGRQPALIEELRARAGLAGDRGELVREALSLLPSWP